MWARGACFCYGPQWDGVRSFIARSLLVDHPHMTIAGHGCPKWSAWIVAATIVCACAGGWAGSTALAQSNDAAVIPAQTTQTPSAEMVIEVRAVWGGGPARSFAGAITVSDGSLEVIRNLSIQDDAAAAVLTSERNQLAIRPHSPASFGGVDLKIRGKPDSQLTFEFREPGSAEHPQTIQVLLKQLLSGREQFTIDKRGSKLALERPLHDRLRARLNQGRSILRLGETANLLVEGYRTNMPAGDYRLNVRLQETVSGRSNYATYQDITIDEQGSFTPANFNVTLPDQAGVYEFDISLARKRLINNLIGTTALPNRRVEFVIAPGPGDSTTPKNALSTTQWQSLAQIYPAGVSWWDSLGKFRIPTVKNISPLVSQVVRPLSSGDHQRQMIGNRECMVLAAGAWQAFPLAITELGVPHRVTIQVPAGSPQKLAFSVHEPSQASDAPSLRLDTGLIVEAGATTADGMTTHHMLFWPKQLHSLFLVMNTDIQRQAILAEINLEVAPDGLHDARRAGEDGAVASNLQNSQARNSDLQAGDQRICSVYIDKPLLAENFCAARRVEGPRELDGWLAVWQSSQRLAEYTAWSGHNAATVTVATQGGAIYPSQIWNPTHKFDSGTFIADGSSPDIKDWVELMCCQFDQRGLKLILALDIEGPLAELEQAELEKVRPNPEVMNARYQTDIDGQLAKPNHNDQTPDARRHTLYNPLDSRVQSVLTRLVGELAERYGKHACFAGVQINLSERSHFNFAGDAWGYDAESCADLERSLSSMLPKDAEDRKRLLLGPLRLSFLNERAARLTAFYGRLAKEVVARNPSARLVINPTKLVAMPPASENYLMAASQSLSANDLLMASGVDCRALSQLEHAVLLRPEADSPLRVPASRAWAYRLADDSQLDAILAGTGAGAIVQQLPTSFRLPDFDKVNPYGNGKSKTWLFPHGLSAGHASRRSLVHRLYQADVQHLASGGWLVPIGQEDAVRPLVQAFQQFPVAIMRDLAPSGVSPTLKVRRTEDAGKTYLQLVNVASWPESVTIQLRCPVDSQARKFGCLQKESATNQSGVSQSGVSQAMATGQSIAAGQATSIQLTLPAYGLAGVCVECDPIELLSIVSTPPQNLSERMERRLSELQKLIDRAGELNEQQTLGLRGGDFEEWDTNNLPVGWTVSTHPRTTVSKENELPRSGNACVRLENRSGNNATAWIQSERIAIPTTGRLALEVWVRTLPGPNQPTVRLSLVGRYRDGKRYQRWHEFVSTSDSQAESSTASSNRAGRLPIDWGNRPLVLLVPDVPNEELIELRAAIDVVNAGTLWVDDVRVYGMYLHPDEKVHLSGQMFMAREQMRQGNYALADQMLTSFWSNFLSTYLPADVGQPGNELGRINEARLPTASPTSGPAWRKPNAPRVNQWQENWRNRWQR